jgi:hypothetical protein
MQQRFLGSTDIWTISLLVRTCCLTEEPAVDLTALAEPFQRIGRNAPEVVRYAYDYRSGRYAEALRNFSHRYNKSPAALAELIRAMAHHRLGNAPDASASLKKAKEWMAAADKDIRPALGDLRPGWAH